MINAHKTGTIKGKVGTKPSRLSAFLKRLDELTHTPQRIINMMPTTWKAYRLTLYSARSPIAAKKGITDQIVHAIPGFSPAFVDVEKVIEIAQKIMT
jgi:hypothetical protein